MRRFVSICLLFFVFNGCAPKVNNLPGGSLKLSLDLSSVHVTKGVNTWEFRLILTKNSVKITRSQTVESSRTAEITVDNIYPGIWKIWGGLLDDAEDCIYTGSKTIEIRSMETSEAILNLQPAPGFIHAVINPNFLIDNNYNVTSARLGVYKDPSSGSASYYDLTLQDGIIAGVSGELEPRTYDAKICIPSATNAVFVTEIFQVNVTPGKTTQVVLNSDGRVSIRCNLDVWPQPPAGLTAVYENGEVLLSWLANDEPDLAGYLLYHTNSDGRYILLQEIPPGTTSFIHSNPDPKDACRGLWYYAVAAKDLGGNLSLRSEPAVVAVP